MHIHRDQGRLLQQRQLKAMSQSARLRRYLLLALLPCSAYAQAAGPSIDGAPVAIAARADAIHLDANAEQAIRTNYPRIPNEKSCTRIHSLAIRGDAAPHYRWALRYVDRTGDPVSGRCIGSAGLQIALQRLQNVIAARGYVTTRVVVAAAQPRGGTLTFAVVPGRVGNVQFLPDIGRATAMLRNTVPLRRGALLNLRAIQQALTELRPTASAGADIRILPASHSQSPNGESDLLIVWQPTPGQRGDSMAWQPRETTR